MSDKVVIPGKVNKPDKANNKKFKIEKDKSTESEVTIEIEEDGSYTVEKLSVDGLPTTITDEDGSNEKEIIWLNNFAIKKGNNYINQRYKITIPGIAGKQLVILDGNSGNKPYYFPGPVENDSFMFSDGDPAIGTVR